MKEITHNTFATSQINLRLVKGLRIGPYESALLLCSKKICVDLICTNKVAHSPLHASWDTVFAASIRYELRGLTFRTSPTGLKAFAVGKQT